MAGAYVSLAATRMMHLKGSFVVLVTILYFPRVKVLGRPTDAVT